MLNIREYSYCFLDINQNYYEKSVNKSYYNQIAFRIETFFYFSDNLNLWENINKMKMQVEDKLILSCVKINASLSELECINDLIPLIQDWDYLIKTIIERGIGPLLYKKLSFLSNSSLIPETVKTKLYQVYYKTFSRSALLYEHFRKIVEEFSLHEIPVIALKGVYLSEWLYQDIGLRQFSDIDLLIKETNGDECLIILSELGYKPSEIGLSKFVLSQLEIVHYPAMLLESVSVELHIKLHYKKESYNLIVDELWKNSISETINGMKVSVLNRYDLLIHLCLHLDKHFQGGHVQFTCFNDITNLLERYKETLNWNQLIETCKLYKCEEIVFKYIIMNHKYLNASMPSDMFKKYSALLLANDELVFYKKLKFNKDVFSFVPTHLKALKKIEKYSDKIKYFSDILFPSKDFMIQVYNIKHTSLYLFYYPYRYYIGIRGVMNYLKKKIVGRK